MKILVHKNKVIQISEPFNVHPDYTWYDYVEGVEVGHELIDGQFTAPVDPEEDARNAILLLKNSDLVAIRCVKAGVAFPQEWKEYVGALRDVVNGLSTIIPNRPEYPEGT